MLGDEENPGVMIRAGREIFNEIEKAADRAFLIRYVIDYAKLLYSQRSNYNSDLEYIHVTDYLSTELAT